jgi:hypothetical protein
MRQATAGESTIDAMPDLARSRRYLQSSPSIVLAVSITPASVTRNNRAGWRKTRPLQQIRRDCGRCGLVGTVETEKPSRGEEDGPL